MCLPVTCLNASSWRGLKVISECRRHMTSGGSIFIAFDVSTFYLQWTWKTRAVAIFIHVGLNIYLWGNQQIGKRNCSHWRSIFYVNCVWTIFRLFRHSEWKSLEKKSCTMSFQRNHGGVKIWPRKRISKKKKKTFTLSVHLVVRCNMMADLYRCRVWEKSRKIGARKIPYTLATMITQFSR